MEHTFEGWPAGAPTLLAELAADNTAEFWAVHRERHAAEVQAPMRALAAALEPEFGPVRVFRPQVNRRFRPDAAPYRTDTGGVATSAGGCTLAVVLSAATLSVSAGHWAFDGPQRRRYREAVDGTPGAELTAILDALEGLALDTARVLSGTPRGYAAGHPRIGLLRQRGLQVGRSWALGPWLQSEEPLHRVRGAWRAAGPLVDWLDRHVGAADPAPVRPRPRDALTAEHDATHSALPEPASSVAVDHGG
jgi:uncharacterized protein (DUF2461 family)